ncbi:hypothetical protein Pcinc_038131 [Petrolisthes cinctipes]|uniref:Ig-like domain-containing protein n=1 Tax=Petrolisthes cinctipes TaxID=88211 RepID=A0AAE1BRP0_PETCI|nr:hypothetical protein Pcinc_038131 [Petrolisthes cinctipes]
MSRQRMNKRNREIEDVFDSRGQDGEEGEERQWGDEAAWGSSTGVGNVKHRAWFDTNSIPAELVVRDVRGRDEGSYRCKVHFKASPSWSQRVTLTVTDPPGYPRIQEESGRRLEGPIGPYQDGITLTMICLTSAGQYIFTKLIKF